MDNRVVGALAAARWDDQYRAGRYAGEPPVAFVADILDAVKARRPPDDTGLYIGCGNGRNYIPLVEAGLDLIGIDVSQVALEQLAARLPQRVSRLIHGDLTALPERQTFGSIIAIQVFQHGTREETHDHVKRAIHLLAPGGLFCVRVNAPNTDIEFPHTMLDRTDADGYTVRYDAGPKTGLTVHFFGRDEIEGLTAGLTAVLPLRIHRTYREPPAEGHWDQWEGIWQAP